MVSTEQSQIKVDRANGEEASLILGGTAYIHGKAYDISHSVQTEPGGAFVSGKPRAGGNDLPEGLIMT